MTLKRQTDVETDVYTTQLNRLAAKVLRLHELHDPSGRVMIAISGVPGSGKTTLATALAAKLQSAQPKENFVAMIPMDGFHLYRSQLAAMPNPAEAIHRRGAAFTFDSGRFHRLVQALRDPVTDAKPNIFAPSFDHAVKDPVEDDICVPKEARIIVFEGLYLSLDREPWRSAASLMDELWFLNIDRELSRARLVERHVASGIVPDRAAAEHRVSSTDMLNADDIIQHRLPAHEYIEF
ncbi:putative uridine kinase [Colletotrichum aenigma]|uniref:putative uridine kinase n=1 Tax=Colletotrichum aenigma TaxID=1215731 RepID=UPI0018723F02|nr:putative uridine kinase [Colletotrichum aenigma]KAF5512853.1 putative uridine kinase [Colletotrichum aenigma]